MAFCLVTGIFPFSLKSLDVLLFIVFELILPPLLWISSVIVLKFISGNPVPPLEVEPIFKCFNGTLERLSFFRVCDF